MTGNNEICGAKKTQLRVDVAGGGPTALALAIQTKIEMGDAVRIRLYDSRWRLAEDGRVVWQGTESGNNRRRQVVTLQSNVWSALPVQVQAALFTSGNYTELWPHGPDSPEARGRPRNLRIRWIEDALLQLAQTIGGIELRIGPYETPTDWSDVDVLVIADGPRSRTRQTLNAYFGTPSRELFSVDGKPYDETVLGLEVCSDLPDPYTIPLTVCQNRFLFNPFDQGRGFINMRLTPQEAWEAVGLGANGPVECFQRQPCTMRPAARVSACHAPAAIFKPSVDPASYLWPRIQDALKLFGVPTEGLVGITKFTLGMEQHQRFVAEVAPGKFACLVGDAGPGSIHFWPGRGLNLGLKSAIGASRCLQGLGNRSALRTADFARLEAFMHQLQFREKSRAWTIMRMPKADGTPYLIHDRIEAGLRASGGREAMKAELCARIAAIKKRLDGRMGSLPEIGWYADRFAVLDDSTLRVLVETGPWITGQVGGEEVSVDDLFPRRN